MSLLRPIHWYHFQTDWEGSLVVKGPKEVPYRIGKKIGNFPASFINSFPGFRSLGHEVNK